MLNPALLLLMARYLRSRRGFTAVVTWFSVVGIALGVAALLIVLAVMSGFRQELITRILGATGHAQVEITGLNLPTASVVAARLQGIGGVISATPYVSGQVLVSANGRAGGALVRGIPLINLPTAVKEKLTINAWPTITPSDLPQKMYNILQRPERIQPQHFMWEDGTLLIGVRLAASLGVVPGSGVTLLSPNGARTPVGFIPRTQQATVANLFDMGMAQLDSGLILAPITMAQDLLKKGEFVDAIEIRVQNPREIEKILPQILGVTEKFATSPLDVSVRTWQDDNQEFMQALQVERITMFIILSLIIIVAAFNVITGQMMLVNDKLADIAILRSMGATQRGILVLFMGNGLLLGAAGTAAGLAIGLLGIHNMMPIINFIKALTGVNLFPGDVYFLSELPGRISWPDVYAVLMLTGALTVIASIYPAWRASRFQPTELLRAS